MSGSTSSTTPAGGLVIYGIPHCSTCKKATAWLTSLGGAFEFVDLKTAPPDGETLARWVAQLGNRPLRNTSGRSYRALPADKHSWSDAQWVEAFAADAMLLRRPVMVRDGVAVAAGFLGDENVLKQRLGL